jgi:hypothetical protein
METCLVLTELDLKSIQAGLKKATEYLGQFAFMENRYSSRDQILAYKRTIAKTEENWRKFVETGLTPSIVAGARNPYEWLRFSGDIEIEHKRVLIEFFLYPISETKAGVSVSFDSSIYDAIHSFKPYSEEVIDLNVKQDFIALLLLIVTSFAPTAFALKKLEGMEDLVLHLKPEDIYDWLVAPTKDSIRRWKFQLVGIRAEMVDRQLVERKWSANGMFESSSGYLILDRIAF